MKDVKGQKISVNTSAQPGKNSKSNLITPVTATDPNPSKSLASAPAVPVPQTGGKAEASSQSLTPPVTPKDLKPSKLTDGGHEPQPPTGQTIAAKPVKGGDKLKAALKRTLGLLHAEDNSSDLFLDAE